MNAIRQFLARVRRDAARRPEAVVATAMGRARTFHAYDIGEDTFVFEDGVSRHLDERPSVLVVAKRRLGRRQPGCVFTMTTGNHSVAAFPLLDGRFWRLARLPRERRSDVLMYGILCANVVDGVLETSQRDLPARDLFEHDRWLRETAGFPLDAVTMGDRNETVLEHYRRLGEEWRVKPLAWTDAEMKVALAASKKRIATEIVYYHSARGVHFLSYAEFVRLADRAGTDFPAFVQGLRELVAVYEGNLCSFTRLEKYRGHHEIELFGLRRGIASERLLPELERLMEAIVLDRTGRLGVIQKVQEIAALYRSLLAQPEFADESSPAFVASIYMCVTGEIYAVAGEGTTPAFDDRRTALPGATFVDGRLVMHPGSDRRTEVLLANLRSLMSKDELVQYANVYEIRAGGEGCRLGAGATREVVFKTNCRPLEYAVIEKRLSSARQGYTSYMLARIGALRALGIGLSDRYHLLKHRPGSHARQCDYYVRTRCEGEPMDGIPVSYFRSSEDAALEDRGVVLDLATLLGDAAAQNLAMKKYDPKSESPLFGVGKEIYEFAYDIARQRVVPKRVTTCSVRGSFGWPDLAETDANLDALANFYLGYYAHALKDFRTAHTVPMDELAERFLAGFEHRTHALAWQLSVMRDRFESFAPDVPASFGFAARWRFVQWSLTRQERRLASFRRLFLEKVSLIGS